MSIKYFCDGCGDEVKIGESKISSAASRAMTTPLNMVTINVKKYVGQNTERPEDDVVTMEICDRCLDYFMNHDLPTKKPRAIPEAPQR